MIRFLYFAKHFFMKSCSLRMVLLLLFFNLSASSQERFVTQGVQHMTFTHITRHTAHRIMGSHYTAFIDTKAPQSLLQVVSAAGDPVYDMGDISLMQDGKKYTSDFVKFPPRMHILRNGSYFNEVHIQNIVLVHADNDYWPGLVEYTITFYDDRIYHLVTYIANNEEVVLTPITGADNGVGRRGYEAREGFYSCPEVNPALAYFSLSYGAASSNVENTREAIYEEELNMVSLPTYPEGLPVQSLTGGVLTVEDNDISMPWVPGSRHQIGLMTAFGEPQYLGNLVHIERNPLTANEIESEYFVGYNPRNGLYQFNDRVVLNRAGTKRYPIVFRNIPDNRRIFIEHETPGNVSAGIYCDQQMNPLPIHVQNSLNFPNLVGESNVRETGNSTRIIPLQLNAGSQQDIVLLLYGSHFDSADPQKRATTWLNTLSQGEGCPILQTSIRNQETTTFRFDESIYMTDFRPHYYNRMYTDGDGNEVLAPSAHSATNHFISYYDIDNNHISLTANSIRMMHGGPFFNEYEVSVETEDQKMKGVLRVAIPGTSDHNRVLYALDVEVLEEVSLSEGQLRFLKFFRLRRPGPPVNYVYYAFIQPDGHVSIGEFPRNADLILEQTAELAKNGFMAMYYVPGGPGASNQRAGNPMFVMQDWDVTINGQEVIPGAYAYSEFVDNIQDRGSRAVAIKPLERITTIGKGSRIRYRTLVFTGGDHTWDIADILGEYDLWKTGFQIHTTKGADNQAYFPHLVAQNNQLQAVIQGGKDWLPVKVSNLEPGTLVSAMVTTKGGDVLDLSSGMPDGIWYTAWNDMEDKKGISFTIPTMDNEPVTLFVNIDNVSNKEPAFDIPDQQNISVFPNPASRQLHLSGNPLPNSRIIITDIMGRVRYRGNEPFNGQYTVDVSAMSSGVYVIRCGPVATKFLISR